MQYTLLVLQKLPVSCVLFTYLGSPVGLEHGRSEMMLLSVSAVDSEACRANISEGLTASQVVVRDFWSMKTNKKTRGAVKEMNARAGG